MISFGVRLRIELAIRVTKPCSSASQVISEESDLYWPLKAPPMFVNRATKTHSTKGIFNLFAAILQFSVSTPIFNSKVDFGVHFVTLDNYVGSSDSLSITEFPK